MWDALESVWMEYKNNPEWETAVVPIPYFDKNPDGSFGLFHCEANQFPDYVPVVPYESYDLEGEHPDIIYIHNPYDDRNYVTSVHPDYYSGRLKECTDKLIYIPYFVHREYDVGSSEFAEEIFCFSHVPGVYNADETIVQSEVVRKGYIDALVSSDGEKSREKWERKIKNGGSPKLEKAVRLRELHFEYPDEWLSKIYKKDGTKKKVYFFNTTLSALLLEDEAILDSIRTVIEIFVKFREIAVLLWRPHPLFEATIHAMRPHLAEKYKQLVSEYIEEDIGIFDDSPDMYKAISISDIYYGYDSSVTEIFKAAGLPVKIISRKNALPNEAEPSDKSTSVKS